MTEDQLDHLLERFDERLADKLERNNAVLFGQFTQYFDKRIVALRGDLKADTNEQERVALKAEQERQNGWIGQLAKATNTKLVPEQ